MLSALFCFIKDTDIGHGRVLWSKKELCFRSFTGWQGEKNGSLEMDCGDGGDLDSSRHLDSSAVFIGIDRGLKRRGAGIKTHVLVCLGSAIVMLTSEYMFRTFPSAKADMARMGAQVISGIGFLGVGTIMVTGRNQVRGLTTAACLWVCACEGLAAGIGFVDGAFYGLILIAVTLKLLTRVDTMIHEHAKVFDFYLEFTSSRCVGAFMDTMRSKDVKIVSFDIAKNKLKGEGPSATMSVEVQDKSLRKTLLGDIQAMEEIRFAEEL